MSRQYKRAYELTIIPAEGPSRVISELRVEFEITKTTLGFPNLARFNLYNPSKDTLAAIQRKFTKVIFKAGYEDNVLLLFKGEIRNVFQSKTSVDRIINFYAGDGERDWQNSSFNKTFSSNVPISSAIKEVISTFKNTTVGALEGLPEIADKLRGQTLSGSSKTILDNFANEYGFEWSIQDNEIEITPKDQPLEGEQVVVLNSATGMIGSPTITELGADVSTLLNPILKPNRAFKIESSPANIGIGNLFFRDINKTSAEGIYKIYEVTFKGDLYENNWLSNVKGRYI